MTDHIYQLLLFYTFTTIMCAAMNDGNYDGGTKAFLAVLWPLWPLVLFISKMKNEQCD